MNITPMSRAIYDELARGWNTWDVSSVTAQVLLPQRLRLNLAFVIPERNAYSENACWDVIETFGDHAADGSYTCVDIKLCEGRWRVETAAEGEELLFRVTPLCERPGAEAFLCLEAGGIWGGRAVVSYTETGLCALCGEKRFDIRALSPLAAPAWDPSHITHIYVSGRKTAYFTVNSPKSASEIDEALSASKENWLSHTIRSTGELGEGLDAMRRALLWNMVYESRNDRVITPVSRAWCRGRNGWFGDYVLFDWDTFFAAMQYGLIDKKLAYSAFFSMLEEMTPEGMIPNFGCAAGQSRDRSEPQVGTLCAMRLYAQFGDKEFLENVFEPLLSWNTWRFENRDKNGDGLLELGSTPFEGTYDEKAAYGDMCNKLAAQLESGIDNSTMFDRAKYNEEKHCLEQSYAGLNALMSADCDLLARMADILGKTEEAALLRTRRDRLNGRINAELWSEEAGIYLNKSWDGEFDPTLSLTHFYTLLTGSVCPERQKKLMEHLLNENEFWGEYVVPNIARCDPSFKEQNYWRGRIWAPTNFLLGESLRRAGETRVWEELARKGLDMFVSCWRKKNAVGENYNAITGEAAEKGAASDRFYHWGALMVYMALQSRVNFDEWSGRTQIRERREDEPVIRNVPVKDGRVDI